MAKIKLTINDASARADVDGVLTAGAVGIPVEVTISGDRWAGLTPKLYARNGSTDMEMVVSADGTTTVPWECMIARGVLQLGVDGIAPDASVRIPTIWASCGLVLASAADANPGEHIEPTPDIVDQIHAMAYDADRKAQSVVNDAAAGLFNGKPALIDPVTGNWLLWIGDAYVDSGYPSRGEGGDVDPEQLRSAIEAYMREHPIDLPLASSTEFGIAKFSSNGFSFGSDGHVILPSPTAANITARLANRAVTLNKLDDCVKAAMADGKGAAWTEAEKTEARQRIGAASENEIKDDLSQLSGRTDSLETALIGVDALADDIAEVVGV